MAKNIKTLQSDKCEWDDLKAKWIVGGPVDEIIQYFEENYTKIQNAINLINASNRAGYDQLTVPKLNFTQTDITRLKDAREAMKAYTENIHDEIIDAIDAPFAGNMGEVLDEIITISPENLRVTRTDASGMTKEVSLYEMILPTLDHSDLAIDFKNMLAGKLGEIKEEPSDTIKSAMIKAIIISYRNVDITEADEADKNRLMKYYKLLFPEYKDVIDSKLRDDYENGLIDKSTYDSLRSGILGTFTGFLRESAMSKAQDFAAENASNAIISWLQRNTYLFMDEGLALQTVSGPIHTSRALPNALKSTVRGAAKYGVPIIGGLIDYGIMHVQGEEPVDAAVKATAHVAIGIGGAKAGMAIGAAIGSVIPGAGTAVGAVAGAIIGTAITVGGSMLFDWVYDNKDAIATKAKETITNVSSKIKGIGSAVGGIFSGIATAKVAFT